MVRWTEAGRRKQLNSGGNWSRCWRLGGHDWVVLEGVVDRGVRLSNMGVLEDSRVSKAEADDLASSTVDERHTSEYNDSWIEAARDCMQVMVANTEYNLIENIPKFELYQRIEDTSCGRPNGNMYIMHKGVLSRKTHVNGRRRPAPAP